MFLVLHKTGPTTDWSYKDCKDVTHLPSCLAQH